MRRRCVLRLPSACALGASRLQLFNDLQCALYFQHPLTIGLTYFGKYVTVLEESSGRPYFDGYGAFNLSQVRAAFCRE